MHDLYQIMPKPVISNLRTLDSYCENKLRLHNATFGKNQDGTSGRCLVKWADTRPRIEIMAAKPDL